MRRGLVLGLLLGLAPGCDGDQSFARGTVGGRELGNISRPIFGTFVVDDAPYLHIILTTVQDPCDKETARWTAAAAAAEALQRDWEAAVGDREARVAAADAFLAALDEADLDYAGTGEEERTQVSWDDDPEAPLADAALVEREIGEGTDVETCLFEGGRIAEGDCLGGVSGTLYLEPYGSRFRGEGTVQMAELDDTADPEGTLEHFFDATACDTYGPAVEEWFDESARALALLQSAGFVSP